MTDSYNILVYQPHGPSAVVTELAERFDHQLLSDAGQCGALAASASFQAMVLDLLADADAKLEDHKALLEHDAIKPLPVIVLFPAAEFGHKLRAFELGCDDVLDQHASADEVGVRINKSIYNRIANEQLKSRLHDAHAAASSAQTDTIQLSACLRFLLEANGCDNVDQLGQLFFAAIEPFGISCSLQMRSVYGTKNMEANGMAKDLESQLLEQLSDSGSCIDFGKRTLMNLGRTSLLVRNMPVSDAERCAKLKENLSALLQGLDARVKSLDMSHKLNDGRRLLSELTQGMDSLTAELDTNYRRMMQEMLTVVEELSQTMQLRIPGLGLNEEQERFFDAVLARCVADTRRIVGRGLNVDELCIELWEGMDRALTDIEWVAGGDDIACPRRDDGREASTATDSELRPGLDPAAGLEAALKAKGAADCG